MALALTATVPMAGRAQACATEPFVDNSRLAFKKAKYDDRVILIVYGGIARGDARRLEQQILEHRRLSVPIDEIWLHSQGGNAWEGLGIGRVIRKYGIMTRVPAGFACGSACTTAFLGGPIRSVDPGGRYIVHAFSSLGRDDEKPGDTLEMLSVEQQRQKEQGDAILGAEWSAYATEMGVSTDFSRATMNIPHTSQKTLSQKEINDYLVTNFPADPVGCMTLN
ncbi:hypothetical protein [Zavarzinia aquatilis]|uniref:hypothetical protein n=1 Tax=Zavarzinia aquatilis TaxID=2211142 RepID=UPI001401E7EB|nr:hypothetical protein [Zavarzinia aquatilis]